MEPAKPRAHDDPYDISTHAARSTARLIVPVSVGAVARVVDGLSHAIPQLRLVSLSTAGAEFHRRMNFRTWGMRITLSFQPLRSDQTLVWAECRPKVSTTIWDWGQGGRDLKTLLGAIDQRTSHSRDVP